jgi:hypothetical protein
MNNDSDNVTVMLHQFDLDHIFTYHPPANASEVRKYEILREAAKNFATVIVDMTPSGPDQSVAVRKVREAVMTANAAIALEGRIFRKEDAT